MATDPRIEDWARSGLAAVTGRSDGPPDLSRAPVLAQARARLTAFATAFGGDGTDLGDVDAAELLAGRAGLTGHRRRGQISVGGACRLIRAADGWFALSLARNDDLALVPALLGGDVDGDPWRAVVADSRHRPAAQVVDRARLLGLPAAVRGETAPRAPEVRSRGERAASPPMSQILVADLSSLWAGPLCSRLLSRAGATVVKVESPHRPDGTRRGESRFYDWMNAGKLSYALDFHTDRDHLAQLIGVADVVIEGSRPRALRALGLSADQLSPRPGQVWVRLTAHGSRPPGDEWIGFGDDAAVAGGLVADTPTGPTFCGDAIADPLTGIEAAASVAAALGNGGGVTVDIALAHVAATYAALTPVSAERASGDTAVAEPQPPVGVGGVPRASELGADNVEVRRLVAARC
ncbi:CoA transferase [Gordonia sp. ABSL1-1]|uniref:CoA transferase n=1 Tax=Gordonia sp. ABSL1-1 TaxID=3053923 RepID=UPI002572CE80|nr:CoA transferase [Gordonia sp. ABSL1-1]MDL9936574.1 CoA transferase [Gordonia sp. ABSL1-1]